MSEQNDVPLHQLSRQELQDLIDDLELDVTVDDLVTVLQVLSSGIDVDQVRAAIDDLSKAA
jgi:hypothetical protein